MVSVVCILVFVEELGIAQTTKTVTGVVLIAVQSALTVVLAILIAVNSIITCCKENPHRKRRKEAENRRSQGRSLEDFSRFDGEGIPMEPQPYHSAPSKFGHQKSLSGSLFGQKEYQPIQNDRFGMARTDSGQGLVGNAARFSYNGGTKGLYQQVSRSDEGSPPPAQREPTLPNMRLSQHYRM